MVKRRYVHSPFTLEHMGISISVSEDGKITLTKPADDSPNEVDEVVIPASLIFKLATMLTATRKIHWVEDDKV